jgi:hypothetical protein
MVACPRRAPEECGFGGQVGALRLLFAQNRAGSKVGEPSLERGNDSLSPISHVQALQNHADVAFHGRLCNSERVGDPFVCLSANHESENLTFAWAQIGVGRTIGQASRDGRGEITASRVNAA